MKSLVKLTLSEQVYDILKDDIMTGRISLGEKLINRDLQERFQVSSTPVRDAINKLNQDGLIKEITKTGAQLICFDIDYTREVNDFISSLSCEALSMTVMNNQMSHVITMLKDYLKKQADSTDVDSYFDSDFRFHKVFFDYCGNRFLKETYKRYNLIRLLLIRYAIRTNIERASAIHQHQDIMDAYARGEYELAIKLLHNHYIYGMEQIQKYLPIS